MSARPTQPSPVAATGGEICGECGRDAGSSAFSHVYRDGGRIALCSPSCFHRFLLASDGAPSLAGADAPRPAWSLDTLPFNG